MKDFFVIELPLRELIAKCPEVIKHIPPSVDTSDENYIARVSSNGLEIGYLEDEWTIQKNCTHSS